MITTKDQFHIAAFQTVFKVNCTAGMPGYEAFGKAIALTSDQAIEQLLKEQPDAIKKWKEARTGGRKYRSFN